MDLLSANERKKHFRMLTWGQEFLDMTPQTWATKAKI
jgi:hypothetical protein